MRNLLRAFLITLLFNGTALSQFNSNWQLLSISTPLNLVSFNNNGTGYIYGKNARYKFINGNFSPSISQLKILNPCYVDDGFSYALYDDSTNNAFYYFSPIGGEAWGQRAMSYPNSHFYDINFATKHSGWIVGVKDSFSLVIKTTNLGMSWSNQLDFQIFPKITSIYVKDSLNAIITPFYEQSDDNLILKTTNGGESWIPIPLNSINKLVKILFVDEQNGWIFSQNNKVMRTSNGGGNWVHTDLPNGFSFISASFINSDTGVVTGNSRNIAFTTNGGTNWSLLLAHSSLPNNVSINSVYFKSKNEGWLCTSDGRILKSTNAGYNWFLDIDPMKKITGGYCINNDLIYALDSNKLYKVTENAKKKVQLLSAAGSIKEIKSFTENLIYVLASKFYKTTNGGVNWITVDVEASKCAEFINQDIGFIGGIGGGGPYLKTTNGGLNWFSNHVYPDSLTVVHEILDINFLNETTGLISTDKGKVFKTTDGGESWDLSLYVSSSSTGAQHRMTLLNMLNENIYYTHSYRLTFNGLSPYSNGRIYKTTNQGQNWNLIHEYIQYGTYRYEKMFFHNESDGHVICNNTTNPPSKTLWRTANGGINFSNSLITTNDFFFNGDIGWLFSDNGVIMTNGDINISVQPTSSIIPTTHHLHQNYPNPFNPSTRIKFDIPKGALVKLKVYDMLGREVAELVNENLSAGVYEYEWSATGGGVSLPSGVYFYRLITENFIETRRMVLVK